MSPLSRLVAVLCLAALSPAGVAQSLKWNGPATPPPEPEAPAEPLPGTPSVFTPVPQVPEATPSEAGAPAAAAPAPSTTTDAPQRTGDYLVLMDVDGDRRVSPGEYQDWLSYAFDGMDLNRDGVLSADEQPGGRGRVVTRAEHRARIAERFARQDRNRDGYLDAQELSSPPQ